MALFLVLMPLGAVFHRLVPTPERFVLWVVAAALLLPFFSAFEAIVRRGGLWPSIGWGVLGRALLLAALVAGVAIHTLSPVIALVIPLVALLFVLLEVFAGAAYAVAPNPALIAVVDAVFIAWIATIAIPVI